MIAILLLCIFVSCEQGFSGLVSAGELTNSGPFREASQQGGIQHGRNIELGLFGEASQQVGQRQGEDEAFITALQEDAEDWSVPLEDELEEEFGWRSAMTNNSGKRAHGDARPCSIPSETGMHSPEGGAFSDFYKGRGDRILLEGEMPASDDKKRGSLLKGTKRVAATFVLHRPSTKNLHLRGRDILSGKDLDVLEKTKKKEEKKREKLELERLKRQQRKKYDAIVELVEHGVSRESPKFKALRKILMYVQKLSEGVR